MKDDSDEQSIVFFTDLGIICLLQYCLRYWQYIVIYFYVAVAISLYSSSVISTEKKCFEEYESFPILTSIEHDPKGSILHLN